jgi:hypothetical protein
MRRPLAVVALAGMMLSAGAGIAVAQPGLDPEPPVANCDPFSSIVCQVPITVNVGPIPVDIGSIFSPPPGTP